MKKGIVIALIYLLLASCVLAAALNESAEASQTADPAPEQISAEPGAVQIQVVAAHKPNLLDSAFTWLKTQASWLFARDYYSAGRNLFKWFLNLSTAVKIVAVILFLVLLVIIWNYTLRNSRANNLRQARKHHLKGENAHSGGDEEGAKYHYKKAQEYRERAQEQW